jgi:hypothetical protein
VAVGHPSARSTTTTASGRATGVARKARGTRIAVKAAIAVVGLCLLAFLFVRSVRDSKATPYVIPADAMRGWTLEIGDGAEPTDPVLMLLPPAVFSRSLFGQVFKRIMESMDTPAIPAIPLLLRREFDRSFAGRISPDALAAAARTAGLDERAFVPVCLAHRRASDPGQTRQVYFVLFDAPAFERFRDQLAARAHDGTAGPSGDGFDAAALSPLLFVAASGSTFSHWLPLRANPATDCVSPIAVGPGQPGP